GLFEMLAHLFAIRCGEQRADREEVSLNRYEHLVDTRHLFDRAREADRGIQLIDVAIGLDARMILRHAPAAEEPSVAGVAGSSVDAHDRRCWVVVLGLLTSTQNLEPSTSSPLTDSLSSSRSFPSAPTSGS